MELEQAAALLDPEKLPYPSGIERLPDGTLHVAALTRMPGVTPAMFAWWFGEYMETTEHYRRWHPRDHKWMAWEDKRPGTHVGAKHLVHELIGGRLNKLRITFVPHQEYFGDALEQVPGAVAVCGRPGLLDQPIDMGCLIHLALPRPWGCELHSRFWLGLIRSRNGSRMVEAVGNQPWLRKLRASDTLGRALLVHCHEEMTTLSSFLPELYAAERGIPPA